MPNKRNFLRYWLVVVIWMAVIFSASSDAKSFQHSSRLIGPLLQWLFPHMTDETRGAVIFGIRKCAHLTEYAILALLVWRAIRKPQPNDPRPWSWRTAGIVVLFIALYAATDEFHQLFVPGREGMILDVFIDTVGGTAGLLLLWAAGWWWKRW